MTLPYNYYACADANIGVIFGTIGYMLPIPRLMEYFTPHHYDLSVVMNRVERFFSGTVTVHGQINDGNDKIRLHSKDLVIESVTTDGKQAKFSLKDDILTISHPDLSPGKHIAVVKFSGQITDGMHGLYPCYFEHQGVKKELLATQFESHHAREVFPCIDEPAAKATFDVTLTTEQGVTVLGNMPVASENVEDDRLVTKFMTTPKMSTYLVAWVVGEMHKVSTKTDSGVEVNVWATVAQKPDSLTFALDIAKRSIEFFDDYYGVAYPLPKSDHVALPDFSSGAMENWGLITYREVALLVDPKSTSLSSKQMVATVIAHELSHQWFGNLVTMKWWNNLWLNESFANMMEYLAIDKLYPKWDMWLEFSVNEGIAALRRDSLDGVQPVQTDVNHPDEISALFDPYIVYAKGGRLLRMLQVYIGDEAFSSGLKDYFTKFAYQNTDENDLWECLSKSSGKDIVGLMHTWITQSGFPVVEARSSSGNEVTLTQKRFFIGPHQQSDALWPIPLNSSDSDRPQIMIDQTMTIQHGSDKTLLLNVGDSAHFITHYDKVLLQKITADVKRMKPIDRLRLLHEATMLAQGGIMPSAELIPIIKSYMDESSEPVWTVISLALRELRKFVESDNISEQKLRQFSGRTASEQYERLGWTKHSGESEEDNKLRSIIVGLTLYSENERAIDTAQQLYESTPLIDLDPDLRPLIIGSVVRFGDESIVSSLIDAYKTTQSVDLREDIAIGITSTRLPDQIDKLLKYMQDSEIVRPQDVSRWFVYLIRGRESRQKTWEWLRNEWDWIVKTYSGDKSFDIFPRYAANALSTRSQLQDYIDFFEPKKSMPALKRVIELGIIETTGRVELIERDEQAVKQALLDI